MIVGVLVQKWELVWGEGPARIEPDLEFVALVNAAAAPAFIREIESSSNADVRWRARQVRLEVG